MRTPPPIQRSTIAEALRGAFDIELPVLTFVRGGEDAWGFKVASAMGAYHLKIYRDDEGLAQRLQACHSLAVDRGIPNIVSAIPTRSGHLTMSIDGWTAALFPYLLASPKRESELTDRQGAELGALLARIHAADIVDPLPVEQFDASTADLSEDVLDALPDALHGDNPVYQSAARMLLPCENAIRREIAALRDAAAAARGLSLAFVVCHGDPTAGNVLYGPEPYLIDWDDMAMAPKEKDLVHFVTAENPVLLGYHAAGGDSSLNGEALQYYRALWNNEEIAGFGGRLIFEEHSAAQNEHDLAQLQHFLIYSGLYEQSA